MLGRIVRDWYTTRLPSRAMLMGPAQLAGTVTAEAAESVLPVFSSMATLQRLTLPPRSLAKYRNRPSGDQKGFQSVAGSLVTSTAGPAFSPAAGTVQMSR